MTVDFFEEIGEFRHETLKVVPTSSSVCWFRTLGIAGTSIIDDNCWKMFRNLYVDVDASTCIYDQDR